MCIRDSRFFIDRKRNNKDKIISASNLTNYTNFYRFIRRLSILKIDKPFHLVSLDKVKKLLQDIQQEDPLEEREWLMEKGKELLQNWV